MKTSQKQTSASGAAGSTSSPAAFPASPSVMPGSGEARMMTATSGRICSRQSTQSGPLGSWLKMLLESQRWSSRARLLRWETKRLCSRRSTIFTDTDSSKPLPCNASATILRVTDMTSSRCLFRLVPSEPRTDGTGCSSLQGVLLQTPTAVQIDEPPEKMMARAKRNGYKNGTKFGSLTSQIKYDPRCATLLPTPNASEGEKYTNKWNPNSQMGQSLSAMAGSGLLPTPRANKVDDCNLDNPGVANRNKAKLEEEVAKIVQSGLMPTPTAHCYNQGTAKEHPIVNRDTELNHCIARRVSDDGIPSRLSPLFIEEMIGFPLMWTALPFLSQSGAPNP